MDKQAAVVGLGDVSCGDFGVGSYVLEALSQEPAHPRVAYAFLGLEAWRTGLYTLGKELVFIVHGVSSGQFPGTVRLLDIFGYRRFCDLPARSASCGCAVLDSLAKTALLAPASDRLRFLLIEIRNNSGLCLSKPARLAVRKAVRFISQALDRAGFPTPTPTPDNVFRLYRLELLSLAV